MDGVEVPAEARGYGGDDLHQPPGLPEEVPGALDHGLGLPLADSVPVVVGLHVAELPHDQGVLDAGELHGRVLEVVDEVQAELVLLLPLPPVRPELALVDDRCRILQVLEIEVEPEVLPFRVLARPGVDGGEANVQIHDKCSIQVLSFSERTEEAPKVVVHALAAVAATVVDEVLAGAEGGLRLDDREGVVHGLSDDGHSLQLLIGLVFLGRRGILLRLEDDFPTAAASSPVLGAAALAGVDAGVVVVDLGDEEGAVFGSGKVEAAVVLVEGGAGGVSGAEAPSHVAGARSAGDGGRLAEAVEVDVGKGFDGSAHQQVEEVSVGAVDGGAGVAHLGNGGGGGGGGGVVDVRELDEGGDLSDAVIGGGGRGGGVLEVLAGAEDGDVG